MSPRKTVFAAALALVALAVPAVQAAAPGPGSSVPDAAITAPPAGVHGHPLWDSWYDLKPFGYQEAEYFVSGTAKDATGATAPYTTRIIVTRPSDAKKFNGTALLDWVNVTAQFENAVDTMEARQMLMREGFMYVHVSAQKAGICCSPLTPQVWDPARYGTLNHPGDQFANDLFSQVAKAIRSPHPTATSLDATGGLKVKRVLAAGQSQSCSKLYGYITSTQPKAGVIDGFLIHGCQASKKGFDASPAAKVLHLESDNEADPSPPKPDPNYRLWEVAGTAHSDFFIGYQSVFGLGPRVLADQPQKSRTDYEDVMTAAGNYGEQLHPMLATCVLAGSTMPMHYAASAAISSLNRWVKDGVAPKNSPRFQFDAAGKPATDQYGNRLGGIRMPPIDVPVARYQSTDCPLGGLTVPFTDAEIQALYPTHATYTELMQAKTDAAVRDGWLLPADAADLMRRVAAAKNRWGA